MGNIAACLNAYFADEKDRRDRGSQWGTREVDSFVPF